jgi:glycogen debranching enzyme
VEIRVGPPTLTIHDGTEFLVCARDGTISGDGQQGYFRADTRLVSTYRMALSRVPPTLLNSAVVEPFSARFEFTNAESRIAGGSIERGTLHLRLDRVIGDGVCECYEIVNYAGTRVEFELELRVESDFADLFDVKAERMIRRGSLESRWDARRRALIARYRHGDFTRGVGLHVEGHEPEPQYANGVISFSIGLEPKGRWCASLRWRPLDDSGDGRPARPTGDPASRARRRAWHTQTARVTTSDHGLNETLERALNDLGALSMEGGDADRDEQSTAGVAELVPAAGVPWFVSLFGRDALIVALQTLPISPSFAIGGLKALAVLQGEGYDDRHDLQPGKIEHEIRHGELAHLRLIPQTPYYGTHDATTLFVWTAAETWCWTANRRLLRRLRPHVERALGWIDDDGDGDGDGLQEYRTRAGGWGYYNQGWKDSGDAIVAADGSLAELPIATVELQGYVVAAKRAWADTLEQAFDDGPAARRLRTEADRLAETIEARFWWEAEGCYYLGLDGRKRPIESVASNQGHLLWARAIAADRAKRVVARLQEPDMWSGWGVRTLSAAHVSYNPLAYQRGSVWPHDNAIIADGFCRYGHSAEGAQVARSLLDAAERFQYRRPPEVYAGLSRDEGSFPVQYLGANVPQAWASGAIIHAVMALVGLRPDAPRRSLGVDPHLPPWLDELALTDVRVGEATCDLRIRRGRVAVENLRGELRVHPRDSH